MVFGVLVALRSTWLQPASGFSGHFDLLVASAAKETEYMRDSAGASVAAFVLDGQTNLLPAPAAKAFHYMQCQSVKQTLQAAAAAAAILVRSSFVAIVVHMSEWCWFVPGFSVGCILLWNSCQVHLEKDMLAAFFGKGKKEGCTSKGSQEILLFLRPPGFEPGGFWWGQLLRRRC